MTPELFYDDEKIVAWIREQRELREAVVREESGVLPADVLFHQFRADIGPRYADGEGGVRIDEF